MFLHTTSKSSPTPCCGGCAQGKPCCGRKAPVDASRFERRGGLLLPKRAIIQPGTRPVAKPGSRPWPRWRMLLGWPPEREWGGQRRPWLPAMMPSYDMSCTGCCGCESCPCCRRCPSVSSDIDLWIEGQAQDPDFSGVCDCDAFTTSPIVGLAFDDCQEVSTFAITCDNAVTFEIIGESATCKMRATLSGNSAHSGSPPGGLWSAIWEKSFVGPIECSALHELAFVSATGGADVPCIFAGSTFFADINIPL